MLNTDNLHASVEGRDVLKGLTLTVKPGEVHTIMSPNDAGTYFLAGLFGHIGLIVWW